MRAFAALCSGFLSTPGPEYLLVLMARGYCGEGAGCSRGIREGTEGRALAVGGAKGTQGCLSSSGLGTEETSVHKTQTFL